MLSRSYWGLVEQNGPWRQTPKDVANKHGNYKAPLTNVNKKQKISPGEVGNIGDGIGITPPNYMNSVVGGLLPPKSRKRLFNYRKYNRPDGYNYEQTGRQFMGAGLTEDPNLSPEKDGFVILPPTPPGSDSFTGENSFNSQLPVDNVGSSNGDVVNVGGGYPNMGIGAMAGRAAALAAVTIGAAAALPFVTPLERRLEARRKSTGTDSTTSSISLHGTDSTSSSAPPTPRDDNQMTEIDLSGVSATNVESRSHLPSLNVYHFGSGGGGIVPHRASSSHMYASSGGSPTVLDSVPSVVKSNIKFSQYTKAVGENFRSNVESGVLRLGREGEMEPLRGVIGNNMRTSAQSAASSIARSTLNGLDALGGAAIDTLNAGANIADRAITSYADSQNNTEAAAHNNLHTPQHISVADADRAHGLPAGAFRSYSLIGSHPTNVTPTDALISQTDVGLRVEQGQRKPSPINTNITSKPTNGSPPPKTPTPDLLTATSTTASSRSHTNSNATYEQGSANSSSSGDSPNTTRKKIQASRKKATQNKYLNSKGIN